ncbi:type I-B CRISPR-associated protein Cas7/Cst2/DevR [uncultured Methanoregula sp.]|uniref:type I-B CRISPR-associated protein Cas7/Cst2/DevR n=1 Tax=uncultured Methanoregula sp. TaxID=1005933 RepID=UPI002AABD7BF|nr:type I-B CRISPR-associated protein Cas7/Cst2/DevR [uncultured Methanoregula sp.]
MKSEAKALTITYLTPVSFASLNGSDKESDNISSIKKISVGTDQYPYVSGQAIRRALRNQLEVLNWPLSEGVKATIDKGAATTEQEPDKYIDDDLFGFMGTEAGKAAKTRTSVVRVSPLVALNPYQGDLDFGTNYMSKESEGNPNIFETEIHAGLYRGTILIELDRVGCGDGFTEKSKLDNVEKAKRVKGLLDAIKNLWSSGRQSRTLTDISPKFVVGAMLKTKNPVFLESVQVKGKEINRAMFEETLNDYKDEILESVVGVRQGFFEGLPEKSKSIGEAFDQMGNWIDGHYQ